MRLATKKGVTQEGENPSRSRRQGVQSGKLAVSEGRFYAREEICSRREEWIKKGIHVESR